MSSKNKNSQVISRIVENSEMIDYLSEKPLIVIEPSRNFINLKDLWHYRDLLYVLVLRDIKVRYKQTLLGVLWAIIQPFLLMLLFTFIFGRLAGMPSDDVPYLLFAFSGLVPWTFFANSVSKSSNSLVENSKSDYESLFSGEL